jgi:HEAT repeat protein
MEQRDDLSGPPSPPAGDDLLPPVEPPSASFIIQLFVVPALIVLVIVAVWFTFSWLVRRTTPDAVIQGLEHGPSIARWQRASELADLLRNQRFADFKRSAEDAEHVARILQRETDEAAAGDGMREEDVTLRYFLARALGEFEVQNGLGALLTAAETGRHPSEHLVQSGALEAIAVRAYNLRQLDPPQLIAHPELIPTLSRLASDEEPLIRSKTAFALGQIGTLEALTLLETLVDDPDPDTRYNAAVGLAHHGNAAALETLAEMLDLNELARLPQATDEKSQALRRAVIVGNALQAVDTLAVQNRSADFSPVIESLEQLAAADADALRQLHLPTRVISDARRELERLRASGADIREQSTE